MRAGFEFFRCGATWRAASANTARCLVGCTSGDMLALFLMQRYAPELSFSTQMAVSMSAGLLTSIALETAWLAHFNDMPKRRALRTALGMSFTSMLAMEAAENATEFYLTGGDSSLMLKSLPFAMLAGFLTPLVFKKKKEKKIVQN